MEATEASLLMFLFQLVDETQMPKPQEYTDNFILIKKLLLVGLRGLPKKYQIRSKDPVRITKEQK